MLHQSSVTPPETLRGITVHDLDLAEKEVCDLTPAEKNALVKRELDKNPRATSREIARKTGIPDQTVRRMPAWEGRKSGTPAKERVRRSWKERPLTGKMLAAMPDPKAEDPSEIGEESTDPRALVERHYLENASPQERAVYHRVSRAEQDGTLLLHASVHKLDTSWIGGKTSARSGRDERS
jgi:hypothetical protein